jgi:hypothetical protein
MGQYSFNDSMPTFNGIPMIGGLPLISGNWFFVDAYEGSNSVSVKSNSLRRPWLTLAKAYDACTTAKGDGIVLIARNTGTTANTTQYLSAVMDWTKNGITVWGTCAPIPMFQRSRISNTSTSTALAYLLDVQGADNRFFNISIFNSGSNAAAVAALKLTGGQRNYFKNVHSVGAGHATPAATVGATHLLLDNATENLFEDCVFGTDTVNYVGTLATGDITLDGDSATGGTARNFFRRCMTLSQSTSGQTAHLAIKITAADAITRNNYFEDCKFVNYNEGAISNQLFAVGGTMPTNGKIILTRPTTLGYAAYETGTASVYVDSAAGAATGGIVAAG